MSESNPLLSNATMQGAAKHIESLMDTNGVIKEPQKEAAPVEPKEPEVKAEDNQEVQQQTETQQEETQEVTEQEASVDSNAQDEQETDLHQVIVNGEKIDVDLEELKAGYQKDADYRRKTEELAIERRQLQSEKDRLKNEYSTKMDDLNSLTATLNAELNSELNSKELDKLYDEDPTEAAKLERKIRRRRESLQQSQQKLKRHQEQEFQKILTEEQRKVALKHPEIADPIKGATVKTNMRNYLVQRGFSDQEISGIYDSRMFDVVMDGMKYINTARPVKTNFAKKIVKPSKVVKPGVKSTKEEKDNKSRLAQIRTLKKSGSTKDAVDLLKGYL